MDCRRDETLDFLAAGDYDLGLHRRGERMPVARHDAVEDTPQSTGAFIPIKGPLAFLPKMTKSYAFSFEEEMALGEETCKLVKEELSLPQAPQPWHSRLGIVSLGQSFVSVRPKAAVVGRHFVENIAEDSPYGVDLDYCVTLPESDGAVLLTPCDTVKTEHRALQVSSGAFLSVWHLLNLSLLDSSSGMCAIREDYGLGICWRDGAHETIRFGGRRRIPSLTENVIVNPLRPEALLQLADGRLILFDASTKPILALRDFYSAGVAFANNAHTVIGITREAAGRELALADLRTDGRPTLKFPLATTPGVLSGCTSAGRFSLALEKQLAIFDLRMLGCPWQTFDWDLLGSGRYGCLWMDWMDDVQAKSPLVLLEDERSLILVQDLFSGDPTVRKIKLKQPCLGVKCVGGQLFLLEDDLTVQSFTTSELGRLELVGPRSEDTIPVEATVRHLVSRDEEIAFIYDVAAKEFSASDGKVEQPTTGTPLHALPASLPTVCVQLLKHWARG